MNMVKKLACVAVCFAATAAAVAGTLPAGYAEHEYLESTGTQYIDTGVVITPTMAVEADAQYTEVAAALLVQAAPDGRGEVIFAPEERERIGKDAVALANEKLSGKLVLSEQTRPIKGGFILKNGNVEVNCTFDTLVRLQKAETTGLVAKKLFPDV